MKVALDVSPLESGHRFRGIGFYTQSLVDSLQSIKVKDFQLDLVKDKTIPEDCDLVHYPYFDLFYPTLPLIKKKKNGGDHSRCHSFSIFQTIPAGAKRLLRVSNSKIFFKKCQRCDH